MDRVEGSLTVLLTAPKWKLAGAEAVGSRRGARLTKPSCSGSTAAFAMSVLVNSFIFEHLLQEGRRQPPILQKL